MSDQFAAATTPEGVDPRSSSALVISGAELPAQFHLGRRCDPRWVAGTNVAGNPDAKPVGVLWTAPPTDQASQHPRAGVTTTWSDAYYRRGYDEDRSQGASGWDRLQQALRPERFWPVTTTADAQVVRLDSREDVLAAADRWPGEQGEVSFEAMAADGIDAVWVTPNAIPERMPDSFSPGREDGYEPDWQFRTWEMESVAWLRPDNITVGRPVAADHAAMVGSVLKQADLEELAERTAGSLRRLEANADGRNPENVAREAQRVRGTLGRLQADIQGLARKNDPTVAAALAAPGVASSTTSSAVTDERTVTTGTPATDKPQLSEAARAALEASGHGRRTTAASLANRPETGAASVAQVDRSGAIASQTSGRTMRR